jgi:hypothetical protein
VSKKIGTDEAAAIDAVSESEPPRQDRLTGTHIPVWDDL